MARWPVAPVLVPSQATGPRAAVRSDPTSWFLPPAPAGKCASWKRLMEAMGAARGTRVEKSGIVLMQAGKPVAYWCLTRPGHGLAYSGPLSMWVNATPYTNSQYRSTRSTCSFSALLLRGGRPVTTATQRPPRIVLRMFHPADGENSGASLGGSVMRNGISSRTFPSPAQRNLCPWP